MKNPTGRLEGNDLVLTRRFEAPIEDVWESITRSESTARWFGSWTGTPGVGNTITIRMVFEKDGPESEAHIDACEPPRRLALTTKGEWGMTLEVTLTQAGGVTELRFVHRLTDRKLARDFGPGWEYYLDNLVAARAGEQLPAFDEYYPSMQGHYTDP
ncbi:MAG: SRPBCC family protein [Anaeromyxobacter sp.]|nr:SRPBCC family protein [Anaeromyxobacter sp.]MBL0278537.1 SRPBCC family protein [Anaeromyxobacter sp.]